MRQQGAQQQGQEQLGWQQYIPVELLIGFLIVFWYMVAFLYQLGYKIYFHIPLMYMDYSFTRLLEPALYISVSVVTLIVLLCFIVKIKYSPRRYSVLLIINFICILFLISQTWTFRRRFFPKNKLDEFELLILPEWMIISVITSFLILFSILFIIRFFSNVENGSVIRIKSIPTTDKVLIFVSSLIFLLISTFLIGLFTAETKEIFLVFNKTAETIIDEKKIKFERKYVVLDYYDNYYIVAPLKRTLTTYKYDAYGPEIELMKMEEDKESQIQVLKDPAQFQKIDKEDHQIRLYEDYINSKYLFYFDTEIGRFDEDLTTESEVYHVNPNDVLEACVRVDAAYHEYEQPYLEFGLEFSIEDTNHQILPQKMRVYVDQPLQCQTWVAPKYGEYKLKVVNVNKKIEQLLKEGKDPYFSQTSLHVIGHKIDE